MAEYSHLSKVGELPHQPEYHIFPRQQFGKLKVFSRTFLGFRVVTSIWGHALRVARGHIS